MLRDLARLINTASYGYGLEYALKMTGEVKSCPTMQQQCRLNSVMVSDELIADFSKFNEVFSFGG